MAYTAAATTLIKAVKEWATKQRKVQVFSLTDMQCVFALYDNYGGVRSSAIVCLLLRGDGYCKRLDGGSMPRQSEGIIVDEGGHVFASVETSVEFLEGNGPHPVMQLIEKTAKDMIARQELYFDGYDLEGRFLVRINAIRTRLQRKVAAWRAA